LDYILFFNGQKLPKKGYKSSEVLGALFPRVLRYIFLVTVKRAFVKDRHGCKRLI
jgi:hypothetical protein